MVRMSDIFVRYLDMDVNVSEHVIQNPDGSYTIFINSRLTWERQQEAYEHALGHIKNFDFEKTDSQRIEYDAHSSRASDVIRMRSVI